ncbi:MAG: alpha-ketoglutarate-dependent dioxygenase AlkB family protein [Rhodanobacteraceae bacterium]
MKQLSIFESGSEESAQTLIDGASGRVIYRPALIAEDVAARWFEILRREVAWQSDRRLMYDREVDVPRLMASYRLDAEDLPAPIAEAAHTVSVATGVAFNAVGLNLYRDGSDSVAPHHDRLGDLVKGQPIALLSLGGPRRMTISAQDKSFKARSIDLESGSLLTMDYASQLHFLHGIAKTRASVAPRISLAFRVRWSAREPAVATSQR